MADELVSTAGVLLFDPATEFQILEELEYDEMIQRPEAIRFFTLEQQTTSYAQALLPKKGKVPKAVIREVEHEVDTMRQLYERILISTDEGYDIRPAKVRDTLDWVDYAVKASPAYTPYSFDQSWIPLFNDENRAISYTTILDALPRLSPFQAGQKELNITKLTPIYSLADTKAYPMLGPVPYTRTAYREDGTFRIQTLGRPETQDKASFDGYFVAAPPLEFPNPLDDNVFLNRRTESVIVESDEPLENLLPSFELIMQHAVPDTTNPHRDARPFLKIWDIRMNEIPWAIWKNKFMPEDTIANAPIPTTITPPTTPDDSTAPSEEMVKLYESSWYSGLAARYWLSRQIDGGRFVSVALLSKASSQEPIPVPPLLPDEDDSTFPSGTAEDCIPTLITNFETFANAGIYRPGKKQFEKQEKPGWEGKARCLPLTYIQKEQEDLPLRGRLPWLPDTDQKILNDYSTALKARIKPKEKQTFKAIPKAEVAQPHSDTRLQIIALLKDIENRLPEDIAVDIKKILEQTAPEPKLTKHVYSEATTGELLVCEHTLHQLEGDYAKDPDAYLKKWSARDGGSMVCMFCGESISNDVFVAQDQFDAQGRAMINYASLEKPVFHADHSTKTFAVGLKELKDLFDISQPAEDIMYLIISLLQILPDKDQLKPYLDNIKADGAKLAAAAKGADKNKKALIQTGAGILGFSAAILLIQTHNPPLIPRRSIRGKPFVTSGFPRDSSDMNESPLVDGLLNFLRKTFEDYPVTFAGSSVLFIRLLLSSQRSLRQKILNNLQKLSQSTFKVALDQARDTIKPMDSKSEPTVNSFNPPLFRFAKGQELKPEQKLAESEMPWFICKDPMPSWFSATQVVPQFKETQIIDPIEIAPSAEIIAIPQTGIPAPVAPNVDLIRNRAKLVLAKDFASATYRKMIESNDPTMLQKYTEIVLNTLGLLNVPDIDVYRTSALTIAGDPPLLRDFFKGLLIELAGKLDKATVVNMERELSRNIVLRGMNTSADSAKAVRDKLRALETTDYKQKLRVMSDVGREITKKLQDLGLAPYLVTRSDREMFMRELAATFEEKEEEEQEFVAAQGEAEVPEEQIPEEGINNGGSDEQEAERYDDRGNQLENDGGDYGDRGGRTADGEEYNDQAAFNYEEGYGS